MSSKITEQSQPIAEINIVPFVDIILVILIIFMVTAPFVLKTGFSLDLPKANSAEAIKSTTKLNITISTDGRLLLNGAFVSATEIEDKLKQHTLKSEDTHVVISADKNVLHGKVISVINMVKALGLKKVAIATKKNKEP